MLDSFPEPRSSRTKLRSRKFRSDDAADEEATQVLERSHTIQPAATALAKRGLRVGRTRVGKGLFATKKIVDGSCIGEIEGQVINDDEYVSRYAFDLNGGEQLEPNAPFRFVNHSCEPNCAFELFSFPRMLGQGAANNSNPQSSAAVKRQLLLFAICDIAAGQELTIDYNWPAIFAIPCGCRATACRGWIVTPKDLPQLIG